MNAIKLFLAALAALVCFPALAADSTPRAGLGGLFLLYNSNIAPNALGCVGTFINPTAVQAWRAKPVADFSPALTFDGDACPPQALRGLIINFDSLDGESASAQVTATAGAYLYYGGNQAHFRQSLHNAMERSKW